MLFKAALLALLPGIFVPAMAATVSAGIGNIRNARGHVHIDICPQQHFLKEDCPYSGEAPAHAGTTWVTVHGVPSGDYAIQAFHDENDNHRVDRALFGIPKEGVGFSNDAPIGLGPPKWDAAKVAISGDTHLRLRMRYFLGASGPDAPPK
jgi:uncharacterized protein (DUF2141 family)